MFLNGLIDRTDYRCFHVRSDLEISMRKKWNRRIFRGFGLAPAARSNL